MKKKFRILIGMALMVFMSISLTGCLEPSKEDQTLQDQASSRKTQATTMMSQTPSPKFNTSLERENISNRLTITNDPNQLTWIYPMSNGRVIGRFPVRGKVTSGGKRLNSTQMIDTTYSSYYVTEAPDEMGTYGSSNPYIFWFDPSGKGPFQWQGDYFVTPVPYKIDLGYGTVTYEIDNQEDSKRAVYEQQIKSTKIGGNK